MLSGRFFYKRKIGRKILARKNLPYSFLSGMMGKLTERMYYEESEKNKKYELGEKSFSNFFCFSFDTRLGVFCY
jgi:hypothetical protein